jgi:hypothetical protein
MFQIAMRPDSTAAQVIVSEEMMIGLYLETRFPMLRVGLVW